MKSAIPFAAFVCASMLPLACNNASDKTPETSVVTASLASESDNGSSDPCLVSYQTKLDELLPLAVIQKHYTDDMTNAKKQYRVRADAKRHDMETYTYSWPSSRIQKVKLLNREMEVPVSNQIGLTWVGNTLFMMAKKGSAKDNFAFYYRNMTAQEKEEAFKKAGERMKEKGYDEKTTQTAMNMDKDMAADEIMFRKVAGIGDAAVWRIKEKNLIVLTGNTSFQVVANINANDEENISLAKKLAQEVLNKCK